MAFNLRSILRGSYNKSRVNKNRPGKGSAHPNPDLTTGPLTQYDHQFRKGGATSFLQTINNTQLARTERFECQFNFESLTNYISYQSVIKSLDHKIYIAL